MNGSSIVQFNCNQIPHVLTFLSDRVKNQSDCRIRYPLKKKINAHIGHTESVVSVLSQTPKVRAEKFPS